MRSSSVPTKKKRGAYPSFTHLPSPETLRATLGRIEEGQISPESPFQIPLVRQAFLDKNFKYQSRAVDADWKYHGYISGSLFGFNPYLSTYYFAQNSHFARWLKNPFASARPLNGSDQLIKEILFFLHDYLHIWCYQAVRYLMPELGIGVEPINPRNLETYTFVHLLTEACATVGLDFWYLSAVDLNEVVDLGSQHQTLTTSFHQRDIQEFIRFSPDFQVQTPAFFESMTEFYCSGEFPGFNAQALARSPKLYAWVSHEIDYGDLQRRYTRSWLHYLAGTPPKIGADLSAPCALNKPWQHKLVQKVGRLLWEKVKEDCPHFFPVRRPFFNRWTAKSAGNVDFRFVNLNRVTHFDKKPINQFKINDETFPYFFRQYVTQFRFEKNEPGLERWIAIAQEKKDPELIRYLMKGKEKVPPIPGEPWDLFLLD